MDQVTPLAFLSREPDPTDGRGIVVRTLTKTPPAGAAHCSFKVYVRDTGLLHGLLGIGTRTELERHPKAGGSWEGFVIEQVLAQLAQPKAYYWRTQAGAELDLLLLIKGKRIGIEIKRADAPTLTPSMANALEDLKLHRLYVIYPGSTRYALAKNVSVLSLAECVAELS